jgi:hypothetical protein
MLIVCRAPDCPDGDDTTTAFHLPCLRDTRPLYVPLPSCFAPEPPKHLQPDGLHHSVPIYDSRDNEPSNLIRTVLAIVPNEPGQRPRHRRPEFDLGSPCTGALYRHRLRVTTQLGYGAGRCRAKELQEAPSRGGTVPSRREEAVRQYDDFARSAAIEAALSSPP